MKETLEYILRNIVDHPEEVSVEEHEEAGKTILTVRVNKEDMGKVIGKQGRIIRAVRDLIKLIATKHNVFVDVVLAEE